MMAHPTRERWTIGRVLKWTQEHFAGRGVRTPRLDAELIVAHALDMDRVGLYVQSDQPLVPDERERIKALIRRRLDGEPVAYITGVKEFWGMALRITPDVLVPRPETEEIVEEACKLYQSRATERLRFVDLGTGSGCLATALCAEFPMAEGVAVDISEAALDVARGNLDTLGFANRVEMRKGDMLDALHADDKEFDLIVGNPPYVTTGEIEMLAPEVKSETRVALDGGTDGLDLVCKIVENAHRRLLPGGWLLLEIGSGQDDDVSDIKPGVGLSFSGFRRDLAGIPRVAKWCAQRRL